MDKKLITTIATISASLTLFTVNYLAVRRRNKELVTAIDLRDELKKEKEKQNG